MKNSTIYTSPTPPQLDPRPHADLRAQTRQLANEHLRKAELAQIIRHSQELQNSLLTEYAGDSPENIELLKKCLQEVSILGINFVIPKRRVLLSVHEILRLSNLGFRFLGVFKLLELSLDLYGLTMSLDGGDFGFGTL